MPQVTVGKATGGPSGGGRSDRRAALRILAGFATGGAGLALTATLPGCGFRPRGEVTYTFATATINVPTSPSFALELRRQLDVTGSTRLVDTPAQADVVIDVTSIVDDKGVLSLSSGGRVREFVLTKRVTFNVHDKEGNDWLSASEITIRRNYTFNESEVLAREAQEQQLFREMQTDAIRQLLRRLQSAKRPT